MKKITIVSICSFAFLLVCSIVAAITKSLFSEFYVPLIIGVATLVASGILALVVRDRIVINLVCFSLSAVAMGFIIRAWYMQRGLNNSIFTMILISLGCVLYLWIYFALIRIPIIRESRGVCIAVTALYFIISIVVYVFVVLGTVTEFVSTIGFYAFVEASFIFAMSLEVNDKEELIRNLTLSTYSVFVVAIIVIVFAIMAALGDGDCDCDCGCCEGICDGIDCASDIHSSKQTKRKRRTRL